jgi:hypothetical protein
MFKKQTLIIICLLVLYNISLTKAQSPTLNNFTVSNITSTSATLGCNVTTLNSSATVNFIYADNPSLSNNFFESTGPFPSSNAAQTATKTITNLSPGTTYYWQVGATNASGSNTSTTRSFTTLLAPPAINTINVTVLSSTSVKITFTATGSGTINTLVRWGTSSNNLNNVTASQSGSSSVNADFTLTGLDPNITYYFLSEATNNTGTTQSDILDFQAVNTDLIAHFTFNQTLNNTKNNYTFTGTSNSPYTTSRDLTGNALEMNGNQLNVTISRMPLGITDRTISMWYKINSYAANTYPTIFSYGELAQYKAFGYYKNNTSRVFQGNNYDFSTTATAATANQWYHVVLTLTSGTVRMYIDNQLILTQAVPLLNTTVSQVFSTLRIGPFVGAIYDLIIYNRALNAGEVSSLYSNSTLPVTLTSYSAKAQNNNAVLNWKTASEINNSHFVIERSTDGKNFNQIAIVNAKSAQGADYTYTDYNTTSGTNYYRLLQVDLDGKTTDLGVNSVKFNLQKIAINAYPNPATDFVNLSFEPGIFDTAILIDVNGKVIDTIKIASVQNIAKIDLSNVTTGTYLVQLIGANAKTTKKVIKR